jgi:hypothetical protein
MCADKIVVHLKAADVAARVGAARSTITDTAATGGTLEWAWNLPCR